ncbi:MAG: rhodanese-like domain-containing protein [Chitinophagales bacterium]
MQDITVQELKARLDKDEDLFVIDVRETYEYEEYNIGAENIPLNMIPSVLDDLEEYKTEEIVVHCRSGARSANAKQILSQAGFSKVRNLLGGMVDWKRNFG